jgi:hypothetical protein
VIACSLSSLLEMHAYYYVDRLRWLINDDENDYIDDVFTLQLCFFI